MKMKKVTAFMMTSAVSGTGRNFMRGVNSIFHHVEIADATCRLGGVVLCLESPDMTAFAEYSLRTSEGDTKTKAHQIDAENVKIRQLEPECLFSY